MFHSHPASTRRLRTRVRALMTLVLLTCLSGLYAQPTFLEGEDPLSDAQHWAPVPQLSDEFDGPEIDLNKWQIEPVGNDWNWIGRAPGLFLPSSVSTTDGNLRVEVGVLEEPRFINKDTFLYYGGIVRALEPGHHGWYYEARMKANHTEMSSTFWIMSKYNCEKKQELDVQECVGVISPEKASWVKNWDRIFHSNAIHRTTECNPEPTQIQGQTLLDGYVWEDYHVYGCWWKSPDELRFYLDGKYVYSITPSIGFDQRAFLHMAIETYDWNPVPAKNSALATAPLEERATLYDWVRVWKPAPGAQSDTGR